MRKVLALVVLVIGWIAIAPAAFAQAQTVETRDITIVNVPENEKAERLVLDELAEQTVLTVHAAGFDPSSTGRIRQCAAAFPTRCTTNLRVLFDERGTAVFQYLILADAVSGSRGCTLTGPRCTLELSVGDNRVVVDTVFGDVAPPPGTVSISPNDDLRDGDAVSIRVDGFPPAAEFEVMVCAGPATSGRRCGSPGLQVPVVVGADGSATIDSRLDVRRVGANGVSCGRRTPCQLVVVSDAVSARATPVSLDLAQGRDVDYDDTRLAVMLVTGAFLIGAAAWIARTTDWSPHIESHASMIDNAPFADLDEEIERFEAETNAEN